MAETRSFAPDQWKHWRIKVPLYIAQSIPPPDGDPAQYLDPVENYALKPLPIAIKNPARLLHVVRGGVHDATVFITTGSANLSEEQKKRLTDINQQAFDDAAKLGGLGLYSQGAVLPNPKPSERSPLLGLTWMPDRTSFCIWNSLEQAKAGSNTSSHAEAIRSIWDWYDNIAIQKINIWTEKAPGNEVIVFENKGTTVLKAV